MSDFWAVIEQHIRATTGEPLQIGRRQPLGGGCINQAWRASDGKRDYFVKVNAAAGALSMFAAEAAGLAELAETATVRVPKPICHGSAEGQAYLVLEYLPLQGGDALAMETLGHQLAALHQQRRPYFGWHRDNTIGSTPQPNGRHEQWITFWRERRLGFQLQLAATNGHGGALQRAGEQLSARLAGLFVGYQPSPVLLHGDLWGGNVGCTAGGEPVMFDPAVYYGDRETDLAMTELFGGFSERFYAAYREALPMDCGYPGRRTLYNLYHILNHLNLFGASYRHQAEAMLTQLLAELG